MDEVLEIFRELVGVVTPASARLHGAWEMSPSYAPSNPDVINCEYKGAIESDIPLVGLLMLCTQDAIEWAKTSSNSYLLQTKLEVQLFGWSARLRQASVFVRLNGKPCSSYAQIDEPPASFVIHEGQAETGVPYEVFRVQGLACLVVLLCNSDVRSSRDWTWRLHESFVARLSPTLARWMTHKPRGTRKAKG
jgi:hypothetical protein